MIDDISKKLFIRNKKHLSFFVDTHTLDKPKQFDISNTFTINAQAKTNKQKNFFNNGDMDLVNINGNIHFNMIYCGACEYTQKWKYNGYIHQFDQKLKYSFWLGQIEVTQELYKAIYSLGDKTFTIDQYPEFEHPEKPIHNVSFYDAIEFCNLLSNLQGLESCYKIDVQQTKQNQPNRIEKAKVSCDFTKNGYRLPSDLEWKYAYLEMINEMNKDTNPHLYKLDDYAWHHGNSNQQIQQIATKKPSAMGFYDLIGNVSEWCYAPYDSSLLESYNNISRMGGSWHTIFDEKLVSEYLEESKISDLAQLNKPRYDTGFRLARTQA